MYMAAAVVHVHHASAYFTTLNKPQMCIRDRHLTI